MSAGRRQVLLGGLCLAGGAARAAVPMQMAGGQMVVPVVLDGQMARMVVDTGAERTVLTRAAVARLGLRLDPYVDSILRGAGGRLETYRNADVGHASLGGMRLPQRAGAKLSLSVTDMALGADGLLGGDLLRHFTLTLDFAAGTLALGPAGSRAGGNAVALRRLWPDLLLATVRLDGRALVALVDTELELAEEPVALLELPEELALDDDAALDDAELVVRQHDPVEGIFVNGPEPLLELLLPLRDLLLRIAHVLHVGQRAEPFDNLPGTGPYRYAESLKSAPGLVAVAPNASMGPVVLASGTDGCGPVLLDAHAVIGVKSVHPPKAAVRFPRLPGVAFPGRLGLAELAARARDPNDGGRRQQQAPVARVAAAQ